MTTNSARNQVATFALCQGIHILNNNDNDNVGVDN